jgi:hypothetical protein
VATDRTTFGGTYHATRGEARKKQRAAIEATKEEMRRTIGDLVAAGKLDPMRVVYLCLQYANMRELDCMLGEDNLWWNTLWRKELCASTEAQLVEYATRLEERLAEVRERLTQLEEEDGLTQIHGTPPD